MLDDKVLGTKLFYQANSAKTFFIALYSNMAALSSGCKPRIREKEPRSTLEQFCVLKVRGSSANSFAAGVATTSDQHYPLLAVFIGMPVTVFFCFLWSDLLHGLT